MSPMIDIQRRHAEVFRVRLGERGPDGYPRKLTDSMRITSRNRTVVDAFTDVYGGDVTEWDRQYQAYLPTTELRILVLPGQSIQQWWEKYKGSVCERRCDGYQEQKSQKQCVCPEDIDERMKDKDACAPTTRVSLLCPDVDVVGAGQLVTHGLIAAETLPQSIAVAEAALGRGYMVPAMLRVVEHKGRTHFIVPQIEIVGVSLVTLASGNAGGELATVTENRAITAGEDDGPRMLEAVPSSVLERPVGTVAEQAQAFPEKKPRSNAAQPIPPTGIEPRTVDQVKAPSEDTIAELYTLLGPDPQATSTMPELEADLRKLYRLMETAGIPKWETGANGVDALHRALNAKQGAAHVGDLKKAELVAFCKLSWNAARQAVKDHDE